MLKVVKQPMLYIIYGLLKIWIIGLIVSPGNLKTLPPQCSKFEYKGELPPDRVVKTLACYDVLFMQQKVKLYGHVHC